MNRVMRTTIAAVTAVLAAGAAGAQEQTPENAQKFLAQIGGLGQLLYASHTRNLGYDHGAYTGQSGVTQYFPMPSFPATEVGPAGACATRFKYVQTIFTSEDGANSQNLRDGYIPWSSVSRVAVTGVQVEVVSPITGDAASILGPEMFVRFTLPNEALANRVGYAMEFLRLSCDQTEGTGF